MKSPKFVTPNTLTIARILLIPFGVIALFHNSGTDSHWQIIAWWIYFILGMTDIVDGRWARKHNRTTALGAFLDPVADKALIGSAMISLSILDRFPWWITILILLREIGITIFRLVVIRGGVIPANKGGKLKTIMQNFGVGFFILPLPSWLTWFKSSFIAVAILLTITSGISYLRSWSKSRAS